MPGLRRCRRSIWSVPRASPANMRSSMRWFGTHSIKACSPSRARRCIAKFAEEIERRSGNRLVEVAEVLAHHYSQTDQARKLSPTSRWPAAKGLGVYSLDEAATHFTAALALLDKDPDCASDEQVGDFLVLLYPVIEPERK